MPKPRRSPPSQAERPTRDRILQAAMELMAERGIDRVRTRAVAERAGVNAALVHYHFGSMSALIMEAAETALLDELGPSIQALASGETIGDSMRAILSWIQRYGDLTPGSTILAEAMVKSTRDPAFRRWTGNASRRFRSLVLARLEGARDAGQVDAHLDLPAAAVLLAAALDGLLFHRLVDARLDVLQVAEPIDAMLRPVPAPARRTRRRKERHG